MQLNHFDTKLGRGIHLLQSWIDKKTDANAGELQPLDGRFQFLALSNDIKAAFRRNFFTLFGHEADLLWLNAQRNINNLLCVAHLQIQFGHDVLAQAFDVSLLNVAAISAKRGNNSAEAGSFTN